MVDSSITLELTIHEAKIVTQAIASYLPSKENEMIAFMIYNRIMKKLEEKEG